MSVVGFSWIVPGQLAGMARPEGTAEDVQYLKDRGVGAVVTLTHWDWREAAEAGGLEYLHLPMPDFRPPSPEQIDEFMEFCDGVIKGGRGVVVHCLAGQGRTGTMLACYMVHRGLDAQEAIAYVKGLRLGSIETPGQVQSVHEYALRRGRNSD